MLRCAIVTLPMLQKCKTKKGKAHKKTHSMDTVLT